MKTNINALTTNGKSAKVFNVHPLNFFGRKIRIKHTTKRIENSVLAFMKGIK
jgi:hypothetical protein